MHTGPTDVDVDSQDVDESFQVFRAALDTKPGDIRRAWKTLLIAMLQDVRIAFY